MGLSRIEVVTSMSKLTGLKKALSKLGVSGMTVIQVIGCGVEKGTYEYEAELNTEMEFLPKQMIIVVVQDEFINDVVETIKKELYTGHIGDGKIFISPLTNVIRVRTGEEGEEALK
jgi:nitrogen regulatory protein P-II 1